MTGITVRIPPEAHGIRLSEWLGTHGYPVAAACGGHGTCGKCRVSVLSGRFLSAVSPSEELKPDEHGTLLACRAGCPTGGAVIMLPDTDGAGLTDFTGLSALLPASDREKAVAAETAIGKHSDIGVAIDIGTTTLAAALVDCASGHILDTVSCLNPQRSFGADVMSRITACKEGNLGTLHRLIIEAAEEILGHFAKSHPYCIPTRMVVSGNTTMLHLFCGESPESMGAYPFTPVFCEQRTYSGSRLALPLEWVTALPSASAFIGSDIVAGVAVSGMMDSEEPTLLLDIGTNGEMVLTTGKRAGGRLYAASAAAGPALEGAGISCGVGGIGGAVCRITHPSDRSKPLTYSTIGDEPVRGLCGCGLVDLVAELLRSGRLDETGLLDSDDGYTLSGVHVSSAGQALPPEEDRPICLTQQDIRQFQLAKSALAAGVEALADAASLSLDDIRHVLIAGGLGYYLDVPNAYCTGILPAGLTGHVSVIGNSSLAGAVACLRSKRTQELAETIAKRCVVTELNCSPVFSEAFIENMLFSAQTED